MSLPRLFPKTPQTRPRDFHSQEFTIPSPCWKLQIHLPSRNPWQNSSQYSQDLPQPPPHTTSPPQPPPTRIQGRTNLEGRTLVEGSRTFQANSQSQGHICQKPRPHFWRHQPHPRCDVISLRISISRIDFFRFQFLNIFFKKFYIFQKTFSFMFCYILGDSISSSNFRFYLGLKPIPRWPRDTNKFLSSDVNFSPQLFNSFSDESF